MKRLFLTLGLLVGISQAQTTTTITGTIKDLSQALVTSGKVTFTLQPSRDTTISGLARFSPAQVVCLINASGLIKAQDGTSVCTLTMNTALNPPGTYYRVDVWPFNVKTSSFTFYAVLSTYDWSTVVPTPTTSPAQNFVDIFSTQTIGGNKTLSGSTTFNGGTFNGSYAGNPIFSGTITQTASGLFSGTTQVDYFQSNINGCNPASLESGFGGPNPVFEEAIVGCAAVPGSSTKVQVNGIAGLVTNSGTTTRTVGVFGLANALVANTAGVWGANFAVSSLAGFGGNPLYAAENDINLANTTDVAYGLLVAGNWSAQPTTSYGFMLSQPGPNSGAGGTFHWPAGVFFNTGATAAPDSNHCAVCFNPVGIGVNQQSQGMSFVANDPSSGLNTVAMGELPNGNFYISNTKAGTGLLINNIQAAVTVGTGTSTSNGTAIGAGTSQAQPAITITGATTTDTARCALNAAPPATWQTGINFLLPVVTANTVTPWISNGTAGSITPVATAIRCTVTR